MTTPKQKKENIKESPLFWPAYLKEDILYVLDETALPERKVYVEVRTVRDAVKVIRQMKTRAFGQLLVVLNTFLLELARTKTYSPVKLGRHLETVAQALNNSRPTFPFAEVTGMCLSWAKSSEGGQEDIRRILTRNIHGYLAGIRARRLDRVRQIAEVIADGDNVLTHCHVSGELAMAAAVCQEQKKAVHFFATETRPYFQGAKLTAWELHAMGAEVTLVADNAIGSLLADKIVNKVIVGSDRNCANGDFANKIGTYQIAVLASEYGVPFYVLTQPSSRVKRGSDIPIEIRDENELLKFKGRRIVKRPVKGFYPAFDVIPRELVTKAIALHVH